MDGLILKGVRCFRERQSARLAPLTVLVGENSAGKSTLLASTRVAWDIATLQLARFNEDPFELGTWDTIAHYHGGQGKRVTELTVGLTLRTTGPVRRSPRTNIEATFAEHRGQPRLTRWRLRSHGINLIVDLSDPAEPKATVDERGNRSQSMSLTNHWGLFGYGDTAIGYPPLGYLAYALSKSQKGRQGLGERLMSVFHSIESRLIPPLRPIALAPVRARPRRTYDPLQDQPSAEGEHVPAVLTRIAAEEPERFGKFAASINRFAEPAGLFDSLTVRHLGAGRRKKVTQPFALELHLHGQQGPRSLMDVGYGVSQALPIIVDALNTKPGQTMLVQQPEVHLHPRAQAALGEFFANQVSTGARFVIETHSDYLVDRIRIAVRNGVLKASDVSLLFFARHKAGAKIQAIELDRFGDILEPPQAYRQFFVDELSRVLGDG